MLEITLKFTKIPFENSKNDTNFNFFWFLSKKSSKIVFCVIIFDFPRIFLRVSLITFFVKKGIFLRKTRYLGRRSEFPHSLRATRGEKVTYYPLSLRFDLKNFRKYYNKLNESRKIKRNQQNVNENKCIVNLSIYKFPSPLYTPRSADGPRPCTGRGGGSKFSQNWLTFACSPIGCRSSRVAISHRASHSSGRNAFSQLSHKNMYLSISNKSRSKHEITKERLLKHL